MDTEKPTVLVDMDGVMANFDSGALANIPPTLIVNRADFFVAKDYPLHLQSIIESTYNTPGFFEELEPMTGLFEGWQAMIDAGYSPRVASAPLLSNPNSIEGKIKWLDRIMVPEFGARVVEDAIIDRDKWKYDAIALIDDRPDPHKGPNGENVAKWEHILFGWEHFPEVPLSSAAFRLLKWRDSDHLLATLNEIENR